MNKTDFGKSDNPYNNAKKATENREPKEEALVMLMKSDILV